MTPRKYYVNWKNTYKTIRKNEKILTHFNCCRHNMIKLLFCAPILLKANPNCNLKFPTILMPTNERFFEVTFKNSEINFQSILIIHGGLLDTMKLLKIINLKHKTVIISIK